ncbi:magnesium chelatase subunit D [Lichenicoccus sp.]|uniref:magnesium chelatase subunit D n=1 Tax=Lichenicoccus sp. TaxID=2781899 RepID=UPI003D10C8A4
MSEQAALICRLFALDPSGLVLHLRSRAGPSRDAFVAALRASLPTGAPVRRCPLGIGDDRLLGGLDLSATLASGHRVAQRGLLAETDGGVLLLPMAERLSRDTAARLCLVLDQGELLTERDGVALRAAAQLGAVLLDEGVEDETPPAAMLERAAFRIAEEDLSEIPIMDLSAARRLLPQVACEARILEALCATSDAFGIASLRAPLLALRVARTAAALGGRLAVSEEDATLAARLVLAWRATRMPHSEAPPAPQEQEQDSRQSDSPEDAPEYESEADNGMAERVVEATIASLPADLLERLQGQAAAGGTSGGGRSSAAKVLATQHGRPLPARAGRPERGKRLAVVETLRAAAPWQRVRGGGGIGRRIEVRTSDFRITPRAQTPRSVAIFVVDASGSAALHRLAEAKGAIERLLADCYVRRDRVALIAFRGKTAELLLPPTSALTRARRSLAGLPGGGGTPIAAGIDAAIALGIGLRKRGETPLLVMLTDGRANVTAAGIGDRARATQEAAAAAARLRGSGIASLLVDISPRPEAKAEALAGCMGALYLKLPDAQALSAAMRNAAAA